MRYLLVLFTLFVASCNPFEKPQVDAFYYPDKNNLSEFKAAYDVGSVETCRDWIEAKAMEYNDRGIRRGDYECGVGPKEKYGMTVYDKTVQ